MLPRKSELNSELLPSSDPSGVSQPQKSSSISVLKSFEVNAFKCIDGKYELQGRHGIAVISNPEKTDFKLLIFAKGGKPVSQAVLHPLKNTLTIPQTLYVTLLDAYNVYWSLLFDNEERFQEFICQVCIVRLYSSDASHIVEQVLTPGEGDSVEVGDLVEIQYNGWIVEQNCTRGQLFESIISTNKTQRIKLGQTTIIKGLSNALLGTKKNCGKIVAIPPALAYGKSGMPPKIPGNHALLFLINVVRVKSLSKTKGDGDDVSILSESIQSIDRADEAPLPLLPDDSEDQGPPVSVKERTKSISEKLEQPQSGSKATKTELLNRMAKMGQAVLTGNIVKERSADAKTSISQDESDSESVVSSQEPIFKSQRKTEVSSFNMQQQQLQQQQQQQQIPQQFPPMHQSFLANSTLLPTAQSLMPYQSPYPNSYLQPLPNNMFPMAPMPSTGQVFTAPNVANYNKDNNDLHVGMLVNETRQQNVEMRVTLCRLEEKIEKLRDKMEDSRAQSGDITRYPSLETGLLLQNLTRIIQENEALKQEVYEKNVKIEGLNKRITGLLVDHQTRMEQENTDIEKRSSVFKTSAMESQTKLLYLEEEKLRLAKDLSQRNNELYELQKAYDELRDSHRSLSNLHEPLTREVEDLKVKLLEVTDSKSQWETSVTGLQRLLKAKETEVTHLNEQLSASQIQGISQETVTTQKMNHLEETKIALEREIETLRQESFQKIDFLQRKLREDKSLALEAESRLRNEIEEQYLNQWKKKCDEMVAAESTRKARQITELQEEKQHLGEEATTLQARFDDFKSKTRQMKTQLVSQITDLQNQVDALNVELEDVRNSSELDHTEIVVKVKGIMNSVYQDLKSKLHPHKDYTGAIVLQTVLKVIRKATLRITENVESESDEEDVVDEVVAVRKSPEAAKESFSFNPVSQLMRDEITGIYLPHTPVEIVEPAGFVDELEDGQLSRPESTEMAHSDPVKEENVIFFETPIIMDPPNVPTTDTIIEEMEEIHDSTVNRANSPTPAHHISEETSSEIFPNPSVVPNPIDVPEEIVTNSSDFPCETDNELQKELNIPLVNPIHASEVIEEKGITEEVEEATSVETNGREEVKVADNDLQTKQSLQNQSSEIPIHQSVLPETDDDNSAPQNIKFIFTPPAILASSNEPPTFVEDSPSKINNPVATSSFQRDNQPLFSDDDDADSKSFLEILTNTKPESKKPALATDRVPPPLFNDDDDDDISWLH